MGAGVKLVIAILLGLFTAIVVILYLQSKEAEYEGKGPQVTIMVAGRDIAEGDRISAEMLKTARIPDKTSVKQPGSFEEKDKDKIVGKYAMVPIKLNEQIVTTKLVESPDQSLATILKTWPGTRTVTLSVGGSDASVAGMLRPGDYVDIIGLFTYNIGGQKVEEIRYFEQYVQIVALDQLTGYGVRGKSQGTEKGPDTQRLGYGTVTFAVQPQDALKLILANKLGRFYFTLRPADDEGKKVAYEPFTAEKILGSQHPVWREADERQQFLPPDFLKNFAQQSQR